MIARPRYVERLAARRHDGLVKVVTGLRRCGKSYLLFNLFRDYLAEDGVDDAHVIGVDLEDKENAPLRNPNRLFDHILSRMPEDGKWTYVFIDEIQMCRKVSTLLLVIGGIMATPVFVEYFHTGVVPRFPTLIFSCFLLSASVFFFGIALVLDAIKKRADEAFELALLVVNDEIVK